MQLGSIERLAQQIDRVQLIESHGLLSLRHMLLSTRAHLHLRHSCRNAPYPRNTAWARDRSAGAGIVRLRCLIASDWSTGLLRTIWRRISCRSCLGVWLWISPIARSLGLGYSVLSSKGRRACAGCYIGTGAEIKGLGRISSLLFLVVAFMVVMCCMGRRWILRLLRLTILLRVLAVAIAWWGRHIAFWQREESYRGNGNGNGNYRIRTNWSASCSERQ